MKFPDPFSEEQQQNLAIILIGLMLIILGISMLGPS